ncbi:MAG: hypothetical protein M3Q64_02335, partial [bacterium]|nr:hypothetical protein [bacterium]
LLEAKHKLTEDLAGLSAHTEVGDDYDENATEVQLDDVSHDLMPRMQADLDRIEIALAKIEAGTYGIDDDGNEISEERLRVMPWAEKTL